MNGDTPRGAGGTGAARRLAAGWLALTGTGAAASVALALLTACCVFLGIALPRASLALRDRAVQQAIAALSPQTTAVAGDMSCPAMPLPGPGPPAILGP